MKTKFALWSAAIGATLLAPLGSRAALAQGTPQVTQVEQGATAQAAVEQRIQALKTQLAITPQQEPLWNAFAQKMHENANETERLAQQRASAIASLNAVDNMRSYARIAHEYAADADRLVAAFEGLYATLSPTQKQAADTLFRRQSAAAPR